MQERGGKMAVRRKSNWYIYLITLIVSFVLLGLFVNLRYTKMLEANS